MPKEYLYIWGYEDPSDRKSNSNVNTDFESSEGIRIMFEKLLFRDAFLTMRANKNTYKMSASNNHRERQLETAVKFAEDLGCQFHWFSDSSRRYGERNNLTIQISQFEKSGLYVRITTDDYEELRQKKPPV